MTSATIQTLFGIVVTAFGLLGFVTSARIKRGKLKPSLLWVGSATVIYWQGFGFIAMGLGSLSHLIVSGSLRAALDIIGSLIFLVMTLVARSKAKAAGEI